VEFWNARVRAVDSNCIGLTVAETDTWARRVDDRSRLLSDTGLVYQERLRLVVECRPSGAQVHDVGIAAARCDCSWYPGISAVHPLIAHPAGGALACSAFARSMASSTLKQMFS
jgi:hypothetical protein